MIRTVMKKRDFVGFLSAIFVTIFLLISSPVFGYEPLKGTQLALRGVNAEDAEPAMDNPSSPDPRLGEKGYTKEDHPQGLEQEVRELRQEIEKIRTENEARRRLEIPEEEKSKTVEDILSAAGRQYSLLREGTIGLSYTFSYSYYSGNVIAEATRVERRSNHNFTNTISAEYALWNNLTLSTGIPFVYKYNKVGTSSEQDATDFGDISLGVTWQPFKAGGRIPTTIFSLGASIPTGTSPYRIDLNNNMATGAGYYGVSGGVSLSKVIDPLVTFGNLSYGYGFPENGLSQHWSKNETLTKVEPGGTIGLAFGFGYALSYQASLNMSAQFGYALGSKYTINDTGTYNSGTSLSSSFNIGTGWRITPARSLYVSLGIGLSDGDPDVSLSIKLPFEF